jgi:hypothetical protein
MIVIPLPFIPLPTRLRKRMDAVHFVRAEKFAVRNKHELTGETPVPLRVPTSAAKEKFLTILHLVFSSARAQVAS